VWDIVRALVAQGTTVLLCTQYLDEADQLAGRIAVIDHGRVIAEGTPGQLKASVGQGALHVRLLDPEPAREPRACWPACSRPSRSRADPAALSVPVPTPSARRTPSRSSRARASRWRLLARQPSLDEVFLALTGHPAEEEGAGA
jgi:ABC-2 type transport system ATP-binding protein